MVKKQQQENTHTLNLTWISPDRQDIPLQLCVKHIMIAQRKLLSPLQVTSITVQESAATYNKS